MDSRLLKAAQIGDVASLLKLLDEDPLILEKSIVTPTAETPLHIAAFAGKVDFVREIIRLKSSFAEDLNQDGFSPLHIAAAVGNKDVVLELLKVDPRLCLQEDKQGLIPLHYAAMKGRVLVLKELLKSCRESLTVRTSQGQTVLHLAVKNSQFESFQTLVETLEGDDREEFVIAKDKDGNTVAQMAVSSKQLKVLEYLERHTKVGMKSMEIISVDQLEEGSNAAVPQATHHTQEAVTKTSMDDMMRVAASVVATVTYQGISPPDSIFKGNNNMDLAKNCTMSSVLTQNESCPQAMRYFFLAMAFNTASFYAAFSSLIKVRTRGILLAASFDCLMFTYVFQTMALYPKSALAVIYIYGYLILFIFTIMEIVIVICMNKERRRCTAAIINKYLIRRSSKIWK